jgi:hypothetical protein
VSAGKDPKDVRLVRVAMCSPMLGAERECVRQAIEELNLAIAPILGSRLECVDWENHSTPGVGTHPQDVVSKSLLVNYDVFLGIIGDRLGTPTPKARSGTEEEFDIALADHRASRITDLLLYFREDWKAGLDAERIASFRAKAASEGVYFFEFKDDRDLSRLARLHLARVLNKIVNPEGTAGRRALESGDGLSLDELWVALFAAPEATHEGVGDLIDEALRDIQKFFLALENCCESSIGHWKEHSNRMKRVADLPPNLRQSAFEKAISVAARELASQSGVFRHELVDIRRYGRSGYLKLCRSLFMASESMSKPSDLSPIFEMFSKNRRRVENAEEVMGEYANRLHTVPPMRESIKRASQELIACEFAR